MAVKILWYLTTPDGPYPWEAEGRWKTDFQHLKQIAVTADRLGYYGSLLGSSPNESLAVSAALIDATERLRFLVAQHPGELSPAVLAKWALTFDQFSNGRLLFNVVNGNDASLATYGIHYGHDERYDFSLEYWRAFQSIYAGETGGYDGRYVKLAPRQAAAASHPLGGWHPPKQKPGIPLWGAGTSGPGVAHSVQLLDVYLSFANTPPKLGEKFARVAAEAAKIGRELTFGTRLQVIVRETEEEAWAHAEKLLQRTSIETARNAIQRQLPPGETLESFVSDDPQIQRNLEAIRAGRLPKARDLEIYPNVWVGPSLFGFNILGPAAGTYLVGSAEQVAERIREYERHGTSAFILSGFPLIDEAQRVADLLFPLLDLDHGFEVPQLGVTARAPKAALA
ncbi:LLM class flavin-dependent oxidoreductase [Pseudomonas sp. No.21]|uniref:FMNH(2)-dependent alkanesulfonate monooxygenase n=1 Tax=Pseudomonas tohonis TaxID=2725477 RepID=A0A6J4EBA7_9PSED|nr:LLM class flavin-dependent oxidoreductase [Pseudomonas tohonis]BCG25791.1 FMNH(2)-dependent alkanesulfonate monooxygenase (SsuD-like) [Pseudomonas tohonis]GJN48334.1 FMNH(2)-dependent alkanesulfonate monooxygenase [Pseudomonas tohonis]GJN56338.1 FMNH(2)-dependent alkanesulfonate monooxygenase [Pseudomonas tohonis]